MNTLINIVSDALRMTSREIAELTNKRHDNVARVCRDLKADGVCPQIEETPYVHEKNGQTYLEFQLSKRDSLVLVARLSPEFTGRVVDRWMELEAQKAAPVMLSRMQLIEMAMQAEKERLVLEQKVVADAPKVAFHDDVAVAINAQPVAEVAKVLHTGPRRLFAWLREQGFLMRGNLPYQRYLEQGLFSVVEKTREDTKGEVRVYTQTLVTGKGLSTIQRRFAQQGA
jgi:phage antirepressor YoqD-like protein